jgi:hypothetical protein
MTRLARIGIVLILLAAAGSTLRAQDVVPRDYVGPISNPRYHDGDADGMPFIPKDWVPTSTPPPPDIPRPPILTQPDLASPPTPPQAPPAAAISPDDSGFPSILGPAFGVPKASYQDRFFPEADVHGQTTSLGWLTQDLSASTPIWSGDKSVVSLNAGVRNQVFQGAAVLPSSGTPIPDTLWDIRLGIGYQQTFANDWTMGLSANVVSASDKPFDGTDEIKFGLQGMLRIPVREHDAWILSLTYSPTSQLPFPIPGVAYQWVPSPQFQMLIGLPTVVLYRPTEDLSFTLMWVPITNVRARASYRLMPGLHVYLAYEAANDSYYLSDRTDDQDRLSEYDQRVSGGLKYSPARWFSADVFAGYSFDRYFDMGHSYGDRNGNRFDLSDAPFFGAQATIRW